MSNTNSTSTTETTTKSKGQKPAQGGGFQSHRGEVFRVELTKLDASLNPRKVDTKSQDFIDIKNSMELRGQDEPIQLAAFTTPDGKRPIVSGHHRYTAALMLGWKELDATVRDDVTDEKTYLFVATRANVARKALSAGEQLATVLRLDVALGKGGKGNAETIAAEIGRSTKHVTNLIRIGNNLSDNCRKAFEEEKPVNGSLVVSFDRAAALASCPKDLQDKWLTDMVAYLSGAPQIAPDGSTVQPPAKAPPTPNKSGKPLTGAELKTLAEGVKNAPEDGVFVFALGEELTLNERERAIVEAVVDYCANSTTRGGNDREIVSFYEPEPDIDTDDEDEKPRKAKGKTAKAAAPKKAAK